MLPQGSEVEVGDASTSAWFVRALDKLLKADRSLRICLDLVSVAVEGRHKFELLQNAARHLFESSIVSHSTVVPWNCRRRHISTGHAHKAYSTSQEGVRICAIKNPRVCVCVCVCVAWCAHMCASVVHVCLFSVVVDGSMYA